jgi:hypothetical protein
MVNGKIYYRIYLAKSFYFLLLITICFIIFEIVESNNKKP